MSLLSNSSNKRINKDIIKLIETKFEVTIFKGLNEFDVKFHGPKNTPYENGVWRIRVHLPDEYPFKSPSIRFVNTIFHPNIEESSGTICLDVINQTWTPIYDLKNIFESFIPQLLTYPNPFDPLNRRAASLCLQNPKDFRKIVGDYVKKYATVTDTRKRKSMIRNKNERENNHDSKISKSGGGYGSETSLSDLSDDEN